uniref:chitinase n=1 Tax=Oryzias sinensis TaxID=183150 RepID=A0A8C7WTT7_9TELE
NLEICHFKKSLSSTKLACYFTSWSQYRPGVGKYLPENVDPHLCTYLIYAFAVISSTNEIKIFEWNDEILYKSLIELKYRNPQLKILLAVGRARFGTTQFTIMASTPANRETFIQSSIRFFPHEDKRRFTLLCQELLAAFEKEAAETKKPRLLLTAAVPLVMVMTYDLHGAWDPFTGHKSFDFAMKYWRDQGAPPEKLLVGFATYGCSFWMSASAGGVGAPASGPASARLYTQEAGIFHVIIVQCTFLQGASLHWIDEQMVPYAVKGREWMGFDNRRSFEVKAQYVKDNKFGGALVWVLDLDDLTGQFCGQGNYPLIAYLFWSQVKHFPPASTQPPLTTTNPPGLTTTTSTNTTAKTTTTPGSGSGFCSGKVDDFYKNNNDDNTFYQCVQENTYLYRCPSSLVYNEICKCCDWP